MLCSQLLSVGHFLYFDLSGNNVAVNPESWVSQFENLLVANWARGLVSSREILWQPCVLNLVITDNGNWTVNVLILHSLGSTVHSLHLTTRRLICDHLDQLDSNCCYFTNIATCVAISRTQIRIWTKLIC